ncbi:tetraspanin-8-like [Trachinotus anak]|uniref:tetraspanin-8-like n=1 Tax=Trachinotus anak TaxID=443729 RepID=UPI0039F19C54
MGKINGCLKCLFIFFNVVFAIIGCVLIYGAVKVSSVSPQMSALGGPSLGWAWLFAIGVLGISCLGIFAGCSEKVLALKIFAGFMGVGMVIMLIFGIVVVVTRNKIRDALKNTSSEVAKPIMEDEGMREMLEQLQQSTHCCGVVSPRDWGNRIPASCQCSTYGSGLFGQRDKCISRPEGTTGPSQIYGQPCSDTIFQIMDIAFKISMGFCFGFAITALMGLLVSFFMIHQVKRHDGGGASIAMKGY